ncbi:MAG: hypothetical protein DHS20C15_23790 [Planctomycetota bacterium]|nr:MAG: hypothetical protein DHS20C15_23790 [Planctomycetota bacterium]
MPTADRHWSLTRRMALLFALTTSCLLALTSGFAAYALFSTVRDELRSFLAHETQELAHDLTRSDGSREAVTAVVESIAAVTSTPLSAFRVRDANGFVVAEAGQAHMLDAVREPVLPDASWRDYLLDGGIASAADTDRVHWLTAEVLVDTTTAMGRVAGYLESVLVVFLVSVFLAGLAGWWTARRGLAGLNRVVTRAASVRGPGAGISLQLDGAPQEVRAVGEALEALIRRLDESLLEMRTFTASLAHELRSPVQTLMGETEVALLRAREPAEYQELLRSNLDDLSDLSSAIDNIVAYCRQSEPTQPDARPQSFDFAEEGRLRLEREQRRARRQGVELEIHSEGDTRLMADREACLRVLRNLVDNAVEWSPRGGRVVLSLIGEPEHVLLEVRDEGPGVPTELRERIFEPFVSGPPRATRRAGYGLGLVICRSAVEAHGGTLDFASPPEGGSVFRAVFPRAPRPPEPAAEG